MEGPWCYVKPAESEAREALWGKRISNYVTSPCFIKCDTKGLEVETTMEQPTEKPKKYQLYNEEIFDRIGDVLFSSFDHGDSNYYHKRASDDILSARFKRSREKFFYIGMSFMIICITFVIGNHFRKEPSLLNSLITQMKNCVNCRRTLENESIIQCEKCKSNEQKYGKPSCCKYCQLPAAFVDRLCVHCSYSRRKLGSPVPCSKCALRCAFAKDEKRAKTALCRMCSMNMAPEEKLKHKRATKSSSSKNDHSSAKKFKSLSSSIKDSKHTSTSAGPDHLAQIQQLRDQIVELKSTIMQKDHKIMEKDKTIGTLRTELLVKEKEHLQSLQLINKRNESTVNALKEQVRDLTKQLDNSNQRARLR